MDDYTKNTQSWLDQRFSLTDQSGVYLAHQPIYGFRKGPTEPDMMFRYIVTYQAMKALSHLKFETFLDVGGAEGYKAALTRHLFHAYVRSCDLSQEACARAKAIFNVDGEAVDINRLPYDDNQFDVVLCSETLEHVPDLVGATGELLRVCRKAVVITVPHEPESVIRQNILQNDPHAHIHSLNVGSFGFATPQISRIIVRKILSPFLSLPCVVVDGRKRQDHGETLRWHEKVFNGLVPLSNRIFGKRAAALLMRLDCFLASHTPFYKGFTVILLKDPASYNDCALTRVTPGQIINFEVPCLPATATNRPPF